MKKITVLLCALALALAAGCSSKTMDTASISNALLTQVPYGEQLNEIDYSIFLKRAGIDESLVTNAVVYTGSAAVVDTVAVIETADPDTVSTALGDYIEKQKESYASYKPDEVPKLESAVIKSYSNGVVMCISSDSAAAEETLK